MEKRENMVREQIVRRGIRDENVIRAMKTVERHRFVPKESARLAYTDGPLPIGYGQTISQPYIVAYMTQAAALTPESRVLEIGTGSGYQAAVLAEIARDVYTIEIVPPLADQAQKLLEDLGYRDVHCRQGDGYRGWPEHAPYDAIVVTAAPPVIPEDLVRQLKAGGRMVVPVGTVAQELMVITRTAEGYSQQDVFPVRFVPMVKEKQQDD